MGCPGIEEGNRCGRREALDAKPEGNTSGGISRMNRKGKAQEDKTRNYIKKLTEKRALGCSMPVV
jgi:hypothetical protein